MRISIIIPTLNEAGVLEGQLAALLAYRDVEIIIADGGSTDRTPTIARSYGVRLLSSRPCRGMQQNRGAENAAGTILLFLHCDTRLPRNFPDLIGNVLDRPDTAAGAFQLKIDAAGSAYRIIEWGVNMRSRLLGMPYGDQALFVRKSLFERAGGFPNYPLLEDVELVRRLKRIGRVQIAPAAVVTSARRWKRLGPLRATLVNQIILAGYQSGINPEKLYRVYYKQEKKREEVNG